MHTNSECSDFDRTQRLHAQAVRDSVTLVRRVTRDDLPRPTPCAQWAMSDLLAHMTAQHRGFAAAALGHGQDAAHWTVRPLGDDAAAQYSEAAEQVIAAFATVDTPDRAFALPEFAVTHTFPAAQAVGFHLVDYVVHSWDVARSLGLAYAPGPELLRAALPIARAVPDGASRLAPDSHFRPGLIPAPDASTLTRILMSLGRSPDWQSPSPDAAAGLPPCAAVHDTTC
ncbi:TIGR03086 family metal-binding protein [Streptomyces sp. ISL-100]|uniref:TIGR03086 family metal-binding protein n=1 Tax=Streptomyces sp. ISL-100 TaxID=2819173 RepID=UPI001BE973E9|nr:TIGR03086 family metal-binding protein [Streptomyces sp. ISL-100]MBT2396694.1 TIGR03086 family protein [Streptomyces sp. ISL-100]